MKKLITKIAVKAILFAAVTAVLTAVESSAVITNNVALGQLENSDAAYILMQSVQNMDRVVTMLYIAFSALFIWGIISDIYKFIKTKRSKEETKE